MRRKSTPRFDYEYLSGLASPSAPREVFYLNEAAQKALADLADIVLWPTRWDNFDEGNPAHVQFRGAIYEALKVPYHFDDLIPLFDDVETLLRQLRDAPCCVNNTVPITVTGGPSITPVGMEQTEPVTDTADNTTWPPDYETNPTGATPFADLAAVSDYLCRAASTVFDLLLDMLWLASMFRRLLYPINQLTQQWISSAIVKAYPTAQGALVAFGYDQLWELGDPWLQQIDADMVDDAGAELELARDAIVCAMANASTWQEAVTDVSTVLSATLTSGVMFTWMTSGGLIGFALALLFRGWADPEENTCDCTNPPPPVTGYHYVSFGDLAGDVEGVAHNIVGGLLDFTQAQTSWPYRGTWTNSTPPANCVGYFQRVTRSQTGATQLKWNMGAYGAATWRLASQFVLDAELAVFSGAAAFDGLNTTLQAAGVLTQREVVTLPVGAMTFWSDNNPPSTSLAAQCWWIVAD